VVTLSASRWVLVVVIWPSELSLLFILLRRSSRTSGERCALCVSSTSSKLVVMVLVVALVAGRPGGCWNRESCFSLESWNVTRVAALPMLKGLLLGVVSVASDVGASLVGVGVGSVGLSLVGVGVVFIVDSCCGGAMMGRLWGYRRLLGGVVVRLQWGYGVGATDGAFSSVYHLLSVLWLGCRFEVHVGRCRAVVLASPFPSPLVR
jgi:hypothetical protein